MAVIVCCCLSRAVASVEVHTSGVAPTIERLKTSRSDSDMDDDCIDTKDRVVRKEGAGI